jgi:hypothetical protein
MEVVYAVHNFEAENPDEIAFRIGDPITVIEKDEKFLDGWWQVIKYAIPCTPDPQSKSS